MKIIDLLNKIANGEEVPKKIRIDHWCYEFEWKDYAGNYVDEHEDIDLMSALSCDKEELNYEIHELKEDNKIEKIDYRKIRYDINHFDSIREYIEIFSDDIYEKIDKIIDKLDEIESEVK